MKKGITIYGIFFDDLGYESNPELRNAYISEELALNNLEKEKEFINKQYGYFNREWKKQIFIKPIEIIQE